jgi:hypothetical protein
MAPRLTGLEISVVGGLVLFLRIEIGQKVPGNTENVVALLDIVEVETEL